MADRGDELALHLFHASAQRNIDRHGHDVAGAAGHRHGPLDHLQPALLAMHIGDAHFGDAQLTAAAQQLGFTLQ